MTLRLSQCAPRGLWLGLALLIVGVAQAAPLIVLDLPTTGPLSATAVPLYTGLRADGFDVWWLRVHEPAERSQETAAVVCTSVAPLQRELGAKLDEYVRRGGGLVYLLSISPGKVQEERKFLQLFGVDLQLVEDQGRELHTNGHPVTLGVEPIPLDPVNYELSGPNTEVLATQGGKAIGVSAMVGKGRLVLLPAALVASGNSHQAAIPAKVKLLTQALKWAATSAPSITGTGTVNGPGAATGAAPVASLAAEAVVDLPDIEVWKDLSALVSDELADLALPAQKLGYEKEKVTLAQAALRRPALVVVGAARDFEEQENPALVEYVRNGGSLLVLGYGAPNLISKVRALNKLLGEFGIGFTYARPGGAVVTYPHPITEGLEALPKAPAGSAIWAFADWPLAAVDGRAFATAHEFGQGRIVVFDAATLLPPGDKKAEDNSRAFRRLLGRALKWLTGK